MNTGKLYGLGIGLGDPELLTLKAHRVLTSVPVIAYPTLENRHLGKTENREWGIGNGDQNRLFLSQN